MKLWAVIRSLKPRQIWRLFLLCIGNVRKLGPTWSATKNSMAIASEYYGKLHHQNTPANAFRHALWNYLIAKRCLKKTADIEEVLLWTKEITNLHEDMFRNEELARAMDLHNNKVGRDLFLVYQRKTEKEIINLMRDLCSKSSKIQTQRDLDEIPANQLVHIINMTAL